ncbi:bacteriophage tail protein [Komagataeibacter xylinus E25]|nr:bacteriophage tail protein [Komagataeibacter xylinus E25]
MGIPTYSADQLLAAFKRTLYRGRAWPRGTDTVMHATLSGFMPAPDRFIAAARNLVPDTFPSTTTSVLPEWEETLGLPDPCAGESPTIEQRRAQVVARLTDSGGASIPYYIQFAKTLGYTITITEFAPARAGALRAGQPCCGAAWAYAWRVNAPETTVTRFAAGQSYAGDALANWGNAVLECEIRAREQAHTTVLFAYG